MPVIHRFHAVFVVAFLILPHTARAQDQQVAGTMPEDQLPRLGAILETALRQSPEMIRNEIVIAEGQAAVYSSDHSLWPSLSGGAQYGTNRSSTTGGASNTQSGFFYNVGLNQPVFQWGALANQSRIGRINLLINEKQYAEAYHLLAVSIREQYFSLILKELAVRNARFTESLAKGALDVMEQRLKNGSVAQAELTEPQLNEEDASLSLARNQEDLENSKRGFAHMAGIERINDSDIPMAISKGSYDADKASEFLASLLRDQAGDSLQAQVYKLQIHRSDLNYKIAEVGLLPKFNLGAGYSVENETTAFGSTIEQTVINQLTYNVNMSWTIFDGFATRGAKLSALADRRLNQRLYKTYVETVEDQAQHLARALAIAARYQELTERRWRVQNGALAETKEELKRGSATQNTVDAAQQAWYAVDYANVSARSDYLSYWTEFVSLVGRDPALDNLPPRYVRENP
jgi:outer membrane protein TolC